MDDDGMLYGPEVHTGALGELSTFDVEWRDLIGRAERDLDLEPLVLMLARRWTAGGGAPERAEAHTREYRRWSSQRKIVEAHTSGEAVCECTGPALWKVLDEPQQVIFEEQWQAAIRTALETGSWAPLQGCVTAWYVRTQTTQADREAMAAELAALEADVEEGRQAFWQPS